ncbi:C-X-C motif chemokine 13-like [Eublepharis macularius]|uniref:C-X-C motif chemokine 13-like n=1 Tax=Eublepharis macularius TaxID=481883 RepID=A0AA97JYW4_EUBMA|nr:C-X-C motif chemokine 13-like [Eublepharis macularius]
MKGLTVAVTLGLLISSIVPLQGLPIESLVVNLRKCKCAKKTSSVFDLAYLKSVRVLSPSVYCRRKEIILLTKKDRKICVDPNAPWVQELIKGLTQRQS